ncbi:MAG: hypothetical protein EOO06_08715 [Chitinophagaceae bacterium]|nr:MAG: hypothetical protein EOO06_08715 [Chitinophagaceae bacterium]
MVILGTLLLSFWPWVSQLPKLANYNISATTKPAKQKRRLPPALTAGELEFLEARRFISEWDLMRFFQISESTIYNCIRKAQLQPTRIGGKKTV